MTRLVDSDLIQRLSTLLDFLGQNILGQDEPLQSLTLLLQRAFCGCRYPNRPIASMLLLGPTGVGKTESVNLFTEHLFGKDKLVRLDMSEFMTVDSINVLRGSSTADSGLLGLYYARSGGSGTLLFDEIEKADPLILDVFLQILSAGRFTLATGETLDLTKYVVAATTNIGSRMLMESRSTDRETIERRAIQAGTSEMRPETFARFDIRCVFNKLGWETLNQIGKLHTDKALGLLKSQGHEITIADGVIEYVCREGYSEKFGARAMEQTAMRILGDLASAEILDNGGWPISTGVITYDKRKNVCSLN